MNHDILLGIALGILTMIIIGWRRGTPRDDSDLSDKVRSDLVVHTDYKTGVQYLSTYEGAVTPRLNRDGSLIVVDVVPASPAHG